MDSTKRKNIKKYSRLAFKTGTEAGKKVVKTKLIMIGIGLLIIIGVVVALVSVIPFAFVINGGGGDYPDPPPIDPIMTIPSPILQVIPSPDTDGNIYLRWSIVSVADGYQVFFKPAGGSWKLIKTTGLIAYSYNAYLADGTYYFAVKAYHISGISLLSKTRSVVVSIPPDPDPDPTPPSAPFLKEIVPSIDDDGIIELNWNPSDGADRYQIRRKKSGVDWVFLSHIWRATSYTDSGLEDGTKYYYMVRAHNDVGWGSWSIRRSVTIDMPKPPENPSIIINSGAETTDSFVITLTLSCDNAEKMRFKLSTDTEWTGYETFSTTKSITLSESSVDNPFYTIKVQFSNSYGETGENDAVDGILYVPLEEEPLEAPILNPFIPNINNDGNVILTWTVISNANSYRIYRSKDRGGFEIITTVGTTSYTDSGLEDGIYVYKIKAINSVGESGYSNHQAVKVDSAYIPSSISETNQTTIIIILVVVVIIGISVVVIIQKFSKKKKKLL